MAKLYKIYPCALYRTRSVFSVDNLYLHIELMCVDFVVRFVLAPVVLALFLVGTAVYIDTPAVVVLSSE